MTAFAKLSAALMALSCCCFAQISPVSKLWTASSFVEVCGRADTALSKGQADSLKIAPPAQMMEKLKEVGSDRVTEVAMCLGYISGLEQGWKEGREHGVMAAQWPEGWPQDEKKAVSALPTKQLDAAQAAMHVDVPCIADWVTLDQKRDIVVRYIQAQEKKGNFLIPMALTSHIVWLAFQEAFPCPAQTTNKPPDTK